MKVQLCGGPEDGKIYDVNLHPCQTELHISIYEPLTPADFTSVDPLAPMSFKVGIYYRLSHPRNGLTLFMFDEDSI